MYIGVGISPQTNARVIAPDPPSGEELLSGFDVTWSGLTWDITGGVATSTEGDDSPLSRLLNFPVGNGFDYMFVVEVDSNVEAGTLLIQLYGAANQTIYQAIPIAGLLEVPFTANANNTTIRIRSLDQVVIALSFPSLSLVV